jgi:hypothetical protein
VNLSAGWTLAMLTSHDIFVLTGSLIGAIVSLKVALDLDESVQ